MFPKNLRLEPQISTLKRAMRHTLYRFVIFYTGFPKLDAFVRKVV